MQTNKITFEQYQEKILEKFVSKEIGLITNIEDIFKLVNIDLIYQLIAKGCFN